jgi:hypothetical protein
LIIIDDDGLWSWRYGLMPWSEIQAIEWKERRGRIGADIVVVRGQERYMLSRCGLWLMDGNGKHWSPRRVYDELTAYWVRNSSASDAPFQRGRSVNETPDESSDLLAQLLLVSVPSLLMVFFVLYVLFREPLRIHYLERTLADEQKRFTTIAKKYRDSHDAANDLANPAYQSQRGNALCELFNGNLSITGWSGTVKEFWRLSDGRVGLAVSLPAFETIDPYVTLLSGEETLISPSDLLSKRILSLHRGQGLQFSGQFMPSAKDCLEEVSMTSSGTREQQWLFKFTAVPPQANPAGRSLANLSTLADNFRFPTIGEPIAGRRKKQFPAALWSALRSGSTRRAIWKTSEAAVPLSDDWRLLVGGRPLRTFRGNACDFGKTDMGGPVVVFLRDRRLDKCPGGVGLGTEPEGRR